MSVSLNRLQTRAVFGRAGKRNQNAAAWLRAFERRVESLMRDTALLRQAMAVAPGHRFNDPRYAAGTSVNATDIRATAAWRQSSGHGTSDVTIIAGLPLWITAAFDTETITRHWPSHVSVLDIAASGIERTPKGKRQASKVNPSDERAARLRSAAGTIRMGEQD